MKIYNTNLNSNDPGFIFDVDIKPDNVKLYTKVDDKRRDFNFCLLLLSLLEFLVLSVDSF